MQHAALHSACVMHVRRMCDARETHVGYMCDACDMQVGCKENQLLFEQP